MNTCLSCRYYVAEKKFCTWLQSVEERYGCLYKPIADFTESDPLYGKISAES